MVPPDIRAFLPPYPSFCYERQYEPLRHLLTYNQLDTSSHLLSHAAKFFYPRRAKLRAVVRI